MANAVDWDSLEWLTDKSEALIPDDINSLRIRAFMNTVDIVNARQYISDSGYTIDLPDDTYLREGSVFYCNQITENFSPMPQKTVIEVVDNNTIDAAFALINDYYNPAAVNAADSSAPGGDIFEGFLSQEGSLFTRTDIFRSLFQFYKYAPIYSIEQSPFQYPINKEFNGIYSPGVTVFRKTERFGFDLIDNPYNLSFVSVAPIKRPTINSKGDFSNPDKELTKNKIRTALAIALQHKHDAIVFGNFGYGISDIISASIAHLFREVIFERRFINRFKKIVFAFDSFCNHNPYDFDIFKQCFSEL